MKYRFYEVRMHGCTKYVTALNQREAIILAQAEAIHEGLNYNLYGTSEITRELYWDRKQKQSLERLFKINENWETLGD